MSQRKPDQGRFHIALVTSGLECDVPDTCEVVTPASGEHSEMSGRLGCPRIERQPGTRPDATQLPQKEPDSDRPPPRKIAQSGGQGGRIGVATTDLTDVAGVALGNQLGERLEPPGCPEVISGIPASIE
jgi:hypothetical protein